MGTDRLEALSDRVLAVAITLLVLGLQVPVPGRGSLASQLARAWPSFAAHLVSFLVIGIIWVNHHALLHNIAHIDRTAMFVKLAVADVRDGDPVLDRDPSPRRAGQPPGSSDLRAASARRALSFTALCAWAARRGVLHVAMAGRRAATSVRRFAARPVAILAAIGAAFLGAIAALAAHAAIADYYCVGRSPAGADL